MHVPSAGADQCVIGVVLALPAPEAEAVRAVRADAGDPLAQVVPPHVTLLPPTVVEFDALGPVADHLAEVAAGTRPFEMHLREVETFRPVTPVVYLSLQQGASECDSLQAQVRDESGPLARPLSFPFHPHVTLAHGLDDAGLDRAASAGADLDIAFTVTHLHLYRLTARGQWEADASFALGVSHDLTPLPRSRQLV